MTSKIPRVPLSLSGMRQGDIIGGKYRLEGVIGEGGMGIVLYAIHLDLDRPVAIKLVRADLTDREEIIGRMLLEARAAANIRSEHVARVLDVGRLDSGSPYIVMEYLEGCDLCTLLEHHGRLAPDLATEFVIQACEALAEAHSLDIVHRDLKPENLFLTTGADGEPIIKVLDFGISKDIRRAQPSRRSMTNPANAVGSPHYMAPEQMRAQPDIDLRADIWALGAILFELVTGKPPFDAENLPAVCALVISEDPPRARDIVESVPPGLDAVIWRCLRKDPQERFASVAELASALAPFGSPASALSAERVSRISATSYRRSIMRLPMPSRGDSSPLPRSLVPISVTPRGMDGITALPHQSLESLPPAVSFGRDKRMLAGIGVGVMILAGAFAWGRVSGSANRSAQVEAPPAEHVQAHPAAPELPAAVNAARVPAASVDSRMPHTSVDELPTESNTAMAARVHAPSANAHSASAVTTRPKSHSKSKALTALPASRLGTPEVGNGSVASNSPIPPTPGAQPAGAASPSAAAGSAGGTAEAYDTSRFGGRL